MNKLAFFFIVYVAFFFAVYLIYDLSAFLTTSPIPTPSFLFYTPSTSKFFLGVQLFGLAVLFVIFYFLSGKRYVVGLVTVYVILLILTYFLPAVSILLALMSMGLFISVVLEATTTISKALWAVSSVYLVAAIFSVPFYPLFLVPSVIASGIDAYRLTTGRERTG